MIPVRILHVEDDDEITRPARKVFEAFGWKAQIARKVEEAQAILTRDPEFDAVIVDRQFEGSGKIGDHLARWIHAQASLQHVCVVMLTAYGSAPSAVDALRAGVWQFLEKPQDFNELRELLLVGIAWKKCHRVRSALFSIASRLELHERVREIQAVLGLDALHIIIQNTDGARSDLLGHLHEGGHRFVERVLRGESLEVSGSAAALAALQPMADATRSLLAVPIRATKGVVIGMVAVESPREQKFPPYWRDFLAYIADLIGMSLVAMQTVEYRMQLERAQLEAERARYRQLELVYHELRHTIASHAQTIALNVPKLVRPELITPERIGVIQRNAEAIEAKIRGLRAATNELSLEMTDVDLVELLAQAVEDMSKRLPALVAIVIKGDRTCQWTADPHWMRECFICILQNAVEAIEERRRQDLDYEDDTRETIDVIIEVGDGQVTLTFGDRGIGFSRSNSELLFQPLFSTKTTFPEGGRQETLGTDRIVDMLETTRRQLTTSEDVQLVVHGKKGFHLVVRDFERNGGEPMVSAEIRHDDDSPVVLLDILQGELRHGFGLYTVRRVIQQHNGTIHAASNGPLMGAEFVIRLHKPEVQPTA